MAGPGGVFHGHFLGNQIYKVPKKGEHAAMQGSARQDTILVFSFCHSGTNFRFRLSRGYVCYGLFMIYTHDLHFSQRMA